MTRTLLPSLAQDLRFALRPLRRSPGFTLGVTGILALGIGANAAMFTVLEATLFRPLPYHRPADLVTLDVVHTGQPFLVRSLPDTLAWRDRNHTLTDLAYYNPSPVTLATAEGREAEHQVLAISSSPNLFQLLGAAPALGRSFSPDEQQPGKNNVVVLSDIVWRSQFHAYPAILGQSVHIDGKLCTIVGVMPPKFRFPADGLPAQLWRPIPLDQTALTRGFEGGIGADAIGRLRVGVTPADVARDLSAIQAQLLPLYPPDMHEFAATSISAKPYRGTLNSTEQSSALFALLGAVAVLWLIACANVAGLTLARAAARRRELAVRAALGASRSRIARQILTEALLLSLAGSAVGLCLSQIVLRIFRHRLGQALTPDLPIHPDARILLALAVLSVVSSVLSGFVPALLAARIPIERALRQDGTQSGASRSQHRLQRTLIIGELALTLALLVSCGLLLRSVLALQHVPLGFRTDHVYVITPSLLGYRYDDVDRYQTVNRPLFERVRALPGVEAAEVMTNAPLRNWMGAIVAITPDGAHKNSLHKSLSVSLNAAGPALQKVLGFRMLEGRYFSSADTAAAPPVAVVNHAFAQAYERAGGDLRTFSIGSKARKVTIVGVLDDYHQNGIADPAKPQLLLNAAQLGPDDGFYQPTLKVNVQIALRSTRPPADLLPEIKRVMQQLNPDLVASEVQTMDQIVEDSMGSQLLAAHLLETLGALALLIALAGLYSLLAYLVTLRTRELGLRLALGAQRSDILTLVLRNAATLLLTGIAAGLTLSLAAARLLRTFLFGVQPHDALTLIAAPILLLAVGLLAAFVPARRAASIDPNTALRAE